MDRSGVRLFGAERPDLIISDDLDDPETVRNPAVREKDQLWFDSDFIRAGRPDGKTNFINIDTVKHAESTANLLRQRSGWNTLFFRAIEHPADLWHPTAEQLWREWEKLYTNMDIVETERHAQAQAFYEKNEAEMAGKEIVELWPEVIKYLDVRKRFVMSDTTQCSANFRTALTTPHRHFSTWQCDTLREDKGGLSTGG